MTDCSYLEHLSAYHDGDLPAAESEAVRLHLASTLVCGCREELAALNQLIRDLGELPPGSVHPGGWARLDARLDRRRARRWEWILPLAALVLLAFAIFLFRSRAQDPSLPDAGSVGAVAAGPAPRPSNAEVPGIPTTGPASPRPAVVTAGGIGSGGRAIRPSRPRFQALAAKQSLPPTRVPAELIVAYGAEVEPIDRLLRALRRVSRQESRPLRAGPRVPQVERDGESRHEPTRKLQGDERDALRGQIEALEALRADVMAELVIEAQARAAAPWR